MESSDLSDADPEPEPDFEFPEKRVSGRKPKKESAIEVPEPVSTKPVEKDDRPPTVAEVCKNFCLNDVDLEYGEPEAASLTTYKLFQQAYRPKLQAANPKVCSLKLKHTCVLVDLMTVEKLTISGVSRARV